MKREIKFRTWGKESKKWFYHDEIQGRHGMDPDQECSESYQFTGLRDKNGKEIFEGDLVSWSNKTYTIKWYEKIASFVMEEGENKLERPDIEFQSKVIGNIYESKHLLDNTDTKV